MNSQFFINSHELEEHSRLRHEQLLREADQERLCAQCGERNSDRLQIAQRAFQALAAILLGFSKS